VSYFDWDEFMRKYRAEEAKKNVSNRKFNVGDRVRLTTNATSHDGKHRFDGQIAIIDGESGIPSYPYLVDRDGNRFGWSDDELELVESSDAPSPSTKKPRRTVEKAIKLVGVVSITQDDIKRDHGPHESGIVDVDGKRVDAEAEFYRLLANTPKDEPKRKRRKKTA
jgi:hypothetical protein